MNGTLSTFSTLTISFAPETDESDFADNLLLTADFDTIWAGLVAITQTGHIVKISGKADHCDVKTKRDITLIMDTLHETVTLVDENGKLVICNYIRTDSDNGVNWHMSCDSQESDNIDKLDLLGNLLDWYGAPESWDTDEKTAIWTYLAEVTQI